MSANQHSTGSAVNDTVLRSTRKLFLQSGTGAPAMVIDVSNNIGIGTTTPNTMLDIVKSHNSGTSVDLLSMRFDNNWGLRFQQSYTGVGNIQHNIIQRYNANDITSLIFKNGAVGIQGSGYVIPNNFMAAGSLTIGNSNANYGNGNSNNNNMAGLMLECMSNTEIAVHDSENVFHSLISYTEVGNITIGRNMGWGVANVTTTGYLHANAHISATSYIISDIGTIYARRGFDVVLYADGGQMSVNFGNIGNVSTTGGNPAYLKIGAYGGHSFIESNSSRNIYLRVWHGTFNGTLRQWEFNANAGAYNSINSSTWSQYSDHRIKENIVKANLKT
jgi:hypothetical protein